MGLHLAATDGIELLSPVGGGRLGGGCSRPVFSGQPREAGGRISRRRSEKGRSIGRRPPLRWSGPRENRIGIPAGRVSGSRSVGSDARSAGASLPLVPHARGQPLYLLPGPRAPVPLPVPHRSAPAHREKPLEAASSGRA